MCILCSGAHAGHIALSPVTSGFDAIVRQLTRHYPASEPGVTTERSAIQPRAIPEQRASQLRLTPDQLEAGSKLLRHVPSVDIHSHPARFFLNGLTRRTSLTDSMPALSLETAAREMHAGGVSAVLFSTVADYPLLDSWEQGLRAIRDFHPGEAIAEYQRQMGVLHGLVADQLLPQARDANDIARAHSRGVSACMFCVEGGDFIEGRLDRIARSYDEGVRAITVIHYRTNQIGDTQTETPSHGGLTALGRDIIKEMQRAGIIVDLAHASFATSRDAVDVSTRPMLISHTNLDTASSGHPRLISLEHARLVTRSGGVVGAVAAGFAQSNLSDYIDTIVRMVDLLGVDHVAIGTDLDFTYQPVFTTYLDWHALPAGLLARGLNSEEVTKVMGGNFMRILRENAPEGSERRLS